MNDKIVIAKDGVKRELAFPFDLCLSRSSASWLRDQLMQALEDNKNYGWITIASQVGMQGKPGTAPLPWVDDD